MTRDEYLDQLPRCACGDHPSAAHQRASVAVMQAERCLDDGDEKSARAWLAVARGRASKMEEM
jgi:hypothetical protein